LIASNSQTLVDYILMGQDDQMRYEATALLIDRVEQWRPWPSDIVALGLIAQLQPFLATEIIVALKEILRDTTTTSRYQAALAPAAAEAAFDGLVRIATTADHPHAEHARRALWEVGRESKRVAARLRVVQLGKGSSVTVLRSVYPPKTLR
jgi:hypothetical protein